MSNVTQTPGNTGNNRRRRSRGGQKRQSQGNQEQNNTERSSQNGRQSGGGRREGNPNYSKQNGQNGSQRRPMPAPTKLSWWQKLLKAVGLYKEPARPPRPERRPDNTAPKPTREPRKEKTRDARTEGNPKSSQKDSPQRENRRERVNREGGRSRGGDPSTVENRRVYVGNLSYETTESDLEELFKGVGPVRRIEIVYNRNTHRSKGYGFVEMLDIDEAKRTVEVLNDQFFMGRKLTVSGAKSQDYEAAEKEESVQGSQRPSMPTLAPLHEVKEVAEQSFDLAAEEVTTPTASTLEEAVAPESIVETEAETAPLLADVSAPEEMEEVKPVAETANV